jgi:hypothetical protein
MYSYSFYLPEFTLIYFQFSMTHLRDNKIYQINLGTCISVAIFTSLILP